MYRAIDVAKYILYYYNSRKIPINNLKLQKNSLFCQAEFLLSKRVPLFEDKILAWDFGPVVLSVYRKYAMFGSASIFLLRDEWQNILLNSDQKIVDNVLDYLKDYSSTSLTEIVHCQIPWKDAYYSKRTFQTILFMSFLKINYSNCRWASIRFESLLEFKDFCIPLSFVF